MLKTALVTGASGSIGQAICKEFNDLGYQVLGLDLPSVSKLKYCKASILADLEIMCRDVIYRRNVFDQIRKLLDSSYLNVLVNNAAVQIVKPSEALTSEDWHTTLDVNLLAPFLLTQFFLEDLTKTAGSVINIASIHAMLTKPKFVAYATSKAAVVGLTRSLSVELGHRVRVNAIAPAAICTPMLSQSFSEQEEAFRQLSQMHPIGRIGTPEEVAKAALFLASDQANFITGTTLELDGGISHRLHDPV